MKRDKAFTLIELLAIIVILAIIAVITVPIILNIIENSKMGAATDSAYGYKDSVQKFYVSKLSESANSSLELEGTYTVTDGVLTGTGINEKIPVSGTIPSSGSLIYENGLFKNGCLTIGDYAVTFNTDGTTSTEKGVCEEIVQVPTMAQMCPGCKFIHTTSVLTKETSDMPSDTTSDYTTLSDRPYFLGLIESTTNPGKIGRAFACGVENGTPFCIEGGTDEKTIYESNVGILNYVFDCNADASNTESRCTGSDVEVFAYTAGFLGISNKNGTCIVGSDKSAKCMGM